MQRLILSTAFILMTTWSFAQKKITEGIITYQVKYELPPDMQHMKAMFPETVKVYFKGDSSLAQSKFGMGSTKLIMNAKTKFQRLLIDVPMMGKKYSVRFSA